MTAAEFLRALWPDTGVYALARPFNVPGTTKWTYIHRTFDTIEAAARFVESTKHLHDTFFAVHTLKEAKVWNPTKVDWKTGELGAYEVRTQANMAAARCFFFDLDVGASTPRTAKYATQADALHDLIRFCRETRLPKPLVTSSGGGLHVYWVLTDALPSPRWRDTATQLRQLAAHHHLLADPARTTDTASVLRVAGTYNRKNPDAPRLVRTLTTGTTTSPPEFCALITDALARADITPKQAPVFLHDTDPSGLGSNLDETYDGPPTSFKAVVAACAQVQGILRRRTELSEPEWYHTMNLIRFTENGTKIIHAIAADNPHYNPASGWIEGKLAQLEQKQIKPTSCLKFAELAGDAACVGCLFAGKVKSPIVAARFKDLAPPVVVQQTLGVTVTTTEVPPPPKPYTRLKAGGVAYQAKNRDGDDEITVIYQHDLFPLRRLVNTASSSEQQVWRVMLPREGAKDFVLDSDALYDRRKFVTTIANHGIYPNSSQLPYLQDYMIAYISELQKLTDAEAQNNHLGWSEDRTKFILPDRVLHADGTAKPAMLSLGAQRASAQVHKSGELAKQIELLAFYNHPAYIPNQFFLMAGLGAPIFYATGHHGVILNASGEAGSSKSTTLYTAASFWGQPELYPINGTNNGATVRGRNERVSTLANLPVCVDEITHMAVKDAVDLAMSITQPGHRIRLDTSGVERAGSGGYKATMMLATANNSLHGLLSVDNAAGTAGSMRVVEILFQPHLVHQKHEADAYWYQLKQHYGHIGEAFMVYVLQHEAQVAARVRTVMQEVDMAAGIKSSERFWSATIAAVVVAAEVAQSLGLTTFDPAALRRWALEVQVPYMRGVVTEEYASPLGIVAEYLESINGDMLIASKMTSNANITNITKAPRGALMAHYDPEEKIMWVLKKGFKDYCVRTGANAGKILDDLAQSKMDASGKPIRIVSSKHTRKVLGAGTEFAKAQSWCFTINMAHPEVTGVVDLAVSSTPAKPGLRKIG